MDNWTLSVQGTYAYQIMYGIKNVENRSWKISGCPRKIQIHTTQKTAQPWIAPEIDLPVGYLEGYRSARDSGQLGEYENFHNLVLAEKRFYGVSEFAEVSDEVKHASNWKNWFLKEQAILGIVNVIDCVTGYNSPFAEKNCFNWILSNPILYDIPIMPVMGKQRLWRYL